MTYRLADPFTHRVIAEFRAASFRTPRGAYHAATVQACRHASGGSPVLLEGPQEPILYMPDGVEPGPALARYTLRSVPHHRPRRKRRAPEQLALPLDELG